MSISYLLDENLSPLYRSQLLRHNPNLVVWLIGDSGAPVRGSSDPEILRWCEENGFVLVTSNRKSMPKHLRDHLAAGRHLPGILMLNPEASMGENIEELILISEASFENEFTDLIIYLPLI
jgi:Domain of unknown function (DUF5615)